MSTAKYPQRFNILRNDGRYLEVKIGEIVTGQNEYFYQFLINGKKVGNHEKILTDDVIRINIGDLEGYKSGKYTFMIFMSDPEPEMSSSWRIVTNTIEKLKNWVFNKPVWVQDVFVIKDDDKSLPADQVDQLAQMYSPVVFRDEKEEYLPASIPYILNIEKLDKELANEQMTLQFNLYEKRKHLDIPRKQRKRFAERSDIKFPFKDMEEVLAFNGDNVAVLDTEHLFEKSTKMSKRCGFEQNITVYYSFLENKIKNQAYLNYHFLYPFDPKLGTSDDPGKTGHTFDRESLSVVLNLESQKPQFVVYGAHLAGQKMAICGKEGKKLQRWKGGRVKVPWDEVIKFNDHPMAAIAGGSHAIYPVPGTYAVLLKKHIATLKESASCSKALIPPEYKVDIEKLKASISCFRYKLENLEINSITSNSWNRLLSFSGYLVDILGSVNARFPPFTDREVNIDNWVNKKVYQWKSKKIDEETSERIKELQQIFKC